MKLNTEQAIQVSQTGIGYTETIRSMQKNIQPFKDELERQHLDSVKNLAIISGALASFSMTLFSADLEKLDGLLIVGVSILLVNVIISFTYLIRRLTRGALHVRKIENEEIMPFQRISYETIRCLKGEITHEEWEGKKLEFEKLVVVKAGEEPQIVEPMNYTDDFILYAMTLAIILIILSFIIPYFNTLRF